MSYLLVSAMLSALVIVHELGHLLAARWMGMPVSMFSLGFGPALWQRRKGGVDYRLSAIPLGGYVLLDLNEEKDYFEVPLYKRMVFAMGGPLSNLLFAIMVLAGLSVSTHGLSFESLVTIPLTVFGSMIGHIFTALYHLFDQPDKISGMVGIVVEGGQYVGLDLLKVLNLTVILSINLAIFNLLPLPPLDGGKMVMDVFQRLSKSLQRIYGPAALAGWLLIVGLIVYTTIKDVDKYLI